MAWKKRGRGRRKWMRRTFSQYRPVDGSEVLPCTACGAQPKLSWQDFKNGTLHCRVQCQECGEFLGFAPERIGLLILEGIPLAATIEQPTTDPVSGPGYVPYAGQPGDPDYIPF
jgi:hypothetical protein